MMMNFHYSPSPRAYLALLFAEALYFNSIGQRFCLEKEFIIGNCLDADLHINTSRHGLLKIRLYQHQNSWYFEDLGSHHETSINGIVSRGCQLQDGFVISLKGFVFRFLSGMGVESAYYEKIYELIRTDMLTTVYNRRAFKDSIDQLISLSKRHHQSLSLVMVDIDYFREINTKYGHLGGDEVLRSLAKLLQNKARAEDVVARYGGEEFVILLPSTHLQKAAQFAERLRALVEQTVFYFQDQSIHLTVSCGVASTEGEFDSMALIKQADEKLYLAKKNGRNQVML